MAYILGVDGGGTHTTALLANQQGEIVGRGSASGSNPRALGFANATAAIQAATAAAFASAGLPADTSLAAACLGIAGVGRPADQMEMENWARAAKIAQRCQVVSDVEPILAVGTPAGWGVALISGTGSSCFGISPTGVKLQVGGWGYLLGDEGSGYDVALRALRLATQTADGRAQAHALLAAILAQWGLSHSLDLVAHVYETGRTRAELATLTRPVIALADAGDADALALLHSAAEELARMVVTATERLALVNPPLALSGGLLVASAELRRRVIELLGAGGAQATCVTDPALGTLILAQRLLAD